MKKLSILFCSLVAVIMMSSCSTEINTVAHARSVNANVREAKVMPVNMAVKVDYDKRVQYISEVINLKNVGGKCGALEVAKFDCLYKNNIDVLVDPIFKITKYDNKNVIVMLQAHPGYYVEAPACNMKNNFSAPASQMKFNGHHKKCGKKFGKKYATKFHTTQCPSQGMPMQCHQGMMPMQCQPQGMGQHHQGMCPQGMGQHQGMNCHQGTCEKHQGECKNQCQGGDKGQCQEKCKKEGGECSHK